MPARIVILGGGVGGTLTANLLSRQLGRDAEVTVVDPTGMHVYQPGFLYLALGQANGRWLARDERTLLRHDVELAIEAAERVDPQAGEVRLARGGSLPYDYLVLATGARLVPEQVPGLVEGAHEFYSLQGALRLRERLLAFRGMPGTRFLVGVAGIPYKCPPAPVEFTLMLDQHLRRRGLRNFTELTLLSPLGTAFAVESASRLVEPVMRRRGIELATFFNVEEVDPANQIVTSLEGEKAEYDLLILVPPHRGQTVVEASGLGDADGWVPTDRLTLQHTAHERIFALGDATDLPISKSGSTAHFEAPVVASRIASLVKGTAPKANYGGQVMCFLETGDGRATALRFDYEHPPVPPAPSRFWHTARWLFNRLYWDTVPKGRIPEILERGPTARSGEDLRLL
ncbi:MAG TPA: FAD/NAD(P)-binding oxidoreductase [Actinomycetes bacterium]|jgi:sulfide:quinone oxidoreductase|nr:FAD/NAD(P)-binding oxidoreductase [Actinomycetes bacterium]